MKASCTSPPTPASESWGTCVGVEPAEVDLTGMGMGRLAPWVGDECAEPAACACMGNTRHSFQILNFFGSMSKNNPVKIQEKACIREDASPKHLQVE